MYLRSSQPEFGVQSVVGEGRSHETLPSREHLLSDTDLANVRETDWFQKLIAELPE